MAELVRFEAPDFLKEATEEHFTDVVMSMSPEDIDTSQGQMYYDHTKPPAIIASEITQFHMPLAIQMMFPQFATGPYLEYHGRPYRITRRQATNASEVVKIESGKEGREIPAGILVYTLGDDLESAKEYRTTESVVIENGGAYVTVEAVESGVIGNTPARTIVAAQRGYDIDSVTNPNPVTGGTEAEDDESLRGRILNRIALAPLSGARRDYERWAKEVDGVGSVIVQPLWAGPQTVRVLVTDSNNQIANNELISNVKEYIDPVDGMGEGQAPIGAIVTVDTIEPVELTINAVIYFGRGADEDITLDRIKDNVNRYLINESVVRISEVGAVIIETDGVLDYRDLKINGQAENIDLSEGERAVVSEVVNDDT